MPKISCNGFSNLKNYCEITQPQHSKLIQSNIRKDLVSLCHPEHKRMTPLKDMTSFPKAATNVKETRVKEDIELIRWLCNDVCSGCGAVGAVPLLRDFSVVMKI